MTEVTRQYPDGSKLTLIVHWDAIRHDGGIEPDPGWRYIDAHGHLHYWDAKLRSWPVLREVRNTAHWCGLCNGDYDPLDHYECRLCAEVIEPGTRAYPAGVIQHVTGIEAWRDNVPADGSLDLADWTDGREIRITRGAAYYDRVPVSREEYEELLRSVTGKKN